MTPRFSKAGLVRLLVSLAVTACLLLLPGPGAAGQRSVELSCPGCNVILLNIELLRADFVGLIADTGLTPNIDAFFSDGIVFEDATAPAGETFLSNTAVLTITPPHRIAYRPNKIDRFGQLDRELQTRIREHLTSWPSAAEILADNGYHTISVNQGGRAGDEAFLDRGFKDFSQWSSKVLFEDMVDILIEKLETKGSEPVFVLFRPTLLHNHQYRQPAGFSEKRLPQVGYKRYRYDLPDGTERRGLILKRKRDLDHDTGPRVERSIYRQQLAYADTELRRAFDAINGLDPDRTVVVLYSNHGSALGDNGKYEHGVSYQSCIHIPILIRHPAQQRLTRIAHPVALIDLVPSLYSMLEVPDYDSRYERSLLDELSGPASEERVLIGRSPWDEYVREGRWKLIIEYGKFRHLFDLGSDQNESTDLYSQFPEIARRLESKLIQHRMRLMPEVVGQQK